MSAITTDGSATTGILMLLAIASIACSEDQASPSESGYDGAQPDSPGDVSLVGAADSSNASDTGHSVDSADEPLVPPRFQCGLGENVAPTVPVLEAVPPYIPYEYYGLVLDWNGDGLDDLIGTRILYLNGTLVPTLGPSPKFDAARAVVGDFDGDGQQDIIAPPSSEGWSAALLLKRDGSGAYGEPDVVLEKWTSNGVQFVAGNFDGQGADELAISYEQHVDVYRLGVGSPALQRITTITSYETSFTGLSAVDIDTDGRDELVYRGIRSLDDDLNVSKVFEYPDVPASSFPVGRLRFLDVDLDGALEVVGNNSDGDFLVIRPGAAPAFQTMPNWFPDRKVSVLGDLNGDGLDELFVTTPSEFWLMSRTGINDFEELSSGYAKTHGGPTVVDVDLDGDEDVLVPGPLLFENLGPTGFDIHLAPSLWVFEEDYDTGVVVNTRLSDQLDASCGCLPPKVIGKATDFDQDGRDDLVVASAFMISVARSLGDGSFSERRWELVGSSDDFSKWVDVELETADLTGDGRPEAIVVSRNVKAHCSEETAWAAFSIDDDFRPVRIGLPVPPAYGVTFGDVDGNGLDDMVTFHPWAQSGANYGTDCGLCGWDSGLGQGARGVSECCHTTGKPSSFRITTQVSPGEFEVNELDAPRVYEPERGCWRDYEDFVIDGMLVDVTGDDVLDLIAVRAWVWDGRVEVDMCTDEFECKGDYFVCDRPSWEHSSHYVVVHPGDGSGGFLDGRTISGNLRSPHIGWFVDEYQRILRLGHADVDGDGDEDIFITSEDSQEVLLTAGTPLEPHPTEAPSCYRWGSGGSPLDPGPFERVLRSWDASAWLQSANLNGDLCADMTFDAYFFKGGAGQLTCTLGDKAGLAGAWKLIPIPGKPEYGPAQVIAGDFDGDGLDDVFVRSAAGGEPFERVLLNRTPRPTLLENPKPD